MRDFHIVTDVADFTYVWMMAHADRVTVIHDHVLIRDSGTELKLPPTADQFYEMQAYYMDSGKRLTTSAPSVLEIMEAMQPWLERDQDVLYLTMCANLSNATLNNGRLACMELMEEMELEDKAGPRAICLDSMCISMGLGYLVQLVLENCATIDEAVTYVKRMRARIAHPFSVSEFRYLKAGGRIGKVAGTLADLIQVKPFMDFEFREDGRRTLDAVEQNKRNLLIRDEGSLIQRFLRQTHEQIAPEADRIIIVYGTCKDFAQRLADALRSDFSNVTVEMSNRVGSTIGVHTGPNIISFFYIRKDNPELYVNTDMDLI